MAENTQIISGYIVRPNGDPFTEGVVRFTLGRSDTDEDEVIAAGKYVEFDIASDGSFAAELWPNTRGNVGGAYIVQVREADRAPFETIGRVQVQDDGPYDLAALLRADIPQAQNTFYSVLSQDEYDAFVAEMDAKVAEAQGYAESYDVAAISAAVTATGDDATATAADRVATGEDRVATGQDAVATAADRVATGQDRTAANTAAQTATDAAAAVPDIKTFNTYDESVTYGGSNPNALIFCKEPMILFKGAGVFWRVNPSNPADLFANGEVGSWYDPSDMATLWQDTAGTVPVTAAGQSVARMDDKSGNNHHATQATASRRPTFQAIGDIYWLSFDGVDDALATAAIDFTATDSLSFFAGLKKNTNTTFNMFFEFGENAGSTNGSFALLAPNGGADYGFISRGSAQSQLSINGYDSPITNVVSGAADISADVNKLRVDGVEAGTLSTDQGTGNYGNKALYIGSRGGASLRFDGNLYGLIVRGAASSDLEVTDAELYLAEKTGVTL